MHLGSYKVGLEDFKPEKKLFKYNAMTIGNTKNKEYFGRVVNDIDIKYKNIGSCNTIITKIEN